MEIKKPKSLEEFIEIFDSYYNSGNDYYRGQSDASWDIIAGIARNKNIFTSRIEVEKQLNFNFKEKITKLGLVDLIPIVNNSYDESWQLLMAAQHYSLPTRLLDFSNNKYVALEFAILDSQNIDKDCAVIIYRNADLNQKNDDKFFKCSYNDYDESFFMQAPINIKKEDNCSKLSEIRKFIQGSKFFYQGNKNLFSCLSLDTEHGHNLVKIVISKEIKQSIAEYFIKQKLITFDHYRGKNAIDYCCSVLKNDFYELKKINRIFNTEKV